LLCIPFSSVKPAVLLRGCICAIIVTYIISHEFANCNPFFFFIPFFFFTIRIIFHFNYNQASFFRIFVTFFFDTALSPEKVASLSHTTKLHFHCIFLERINKIKPEATKMFFFSATFFRNCLTFYMGCVII